MKRFLLATVILLVAACSGARGQTLGTRIDPVTQVNWPNATGAGAPSSGACAARVYGLPYTDTLNNLQYVCSASGWLLVNGAAAQLSTTGANGTFWGVAGGVQGWHTPPAGGVVSLTVATANGFQGTFSSGATPILTVNVDSLHFLPVNTLANTTYLNGAGGYTTPTGLVPYPGAGVPCSTGSAWCGSYTVGNSGADLPQLSAGLLAAAVIPNNAANTTGNAATSTALAGGAANDVVYQIGAGVTGFITPVNNAVLITSGAGLPSESATLPNNLTVPAPTLINPALGTPASGIITNLSGVCATCGIGGNAATATTASNLSGATQYAIPYQSAADATAYVAPNVTGSTTQVLVSTASGGAAQAPALTNVPAISAANMTSFPSTLATYPGSGVANSTGTAWGASYGVNGTGNIVLASYLAFANLGGALGTAQGPTSLTGLLQDTAGTLTAASAGNVITVLGYMPTNAAVVPSTAPAAGQILVGNAGGTAYAPVTASGSCTLASTGAFSCTGTALTLQTNSVGNFSSTLLNMETSTANSVGLTVTPSNPGGGIEKWEVTGTYSGGVSSSQVTTGLGYTPANCTAGTTGGDCLTLTSGLVPTANLGSGSATSSTFLHGNQTYSALASGDIPNNAANTTGSAATATSIAGGVANDVPYQTAANTTAFVTPVNSAVMVTSAGGAPSESTTLPGGLTIPGYATTSAATTVNSQTCTLGSTCTIPFQTNSGGNTSQAGINLETSTTNSVGLTVTPVNSATNVEKFEITGGSYTGSAASLSVSGQIGLLTFTGLTSTNRTKTVRDAADTILELGGSYTPTATWNWTSASVTWPTFNQNTTGSAAKWTTARNLAGNSVDGLANVAFANKVILQGTTDAGFSSAQFLGTLGTGIVKNTTTTGVLSIAAAADVYGLWSGSCSSSTYLRGDGACATPSGSSGLSGMTTGQVPIAATASTVTSSEALAGAGAAIVTGPASSTSGDAVIYTGTSGQTADAGFAPAPALGSNVPETTSWTLANNIVYRFTGSGASNATTPAAVSSLTIASIWNQGSAAVTVVTGGPTLVCVPSTCIVPIGAAASITTDGTNFDVQISNALGAAFGTLANLSTLPLTSLTTEAANTTVANVTSGSAAPTAVSIPAGVQFYTSGTGYSAATAAQLGTVLNIATNAVIKSGGTTSAPVASSAIDNGTTFATTDTGGFVAPVFVANGSTAGFMDFPQGTTSAAVAPCNTANSICIQAPTSVTSQLRVLAGAPATGLPLYTNSSGTMTETITAVNGTISTGPALFGSSAVNTVVAQTIAAVAGHFTNLVITSSLGGACTTAPTFNVFDGTTNTGTAKLSTSTTQTKGVATSQSQTLTFAAGDLIGIYISTAGGTCTTDTWVVSAEYTTP